MLRNILIGAAAGAVGTVALNIATYADMAIRGRPGSGVPAQIVTTLADRTEVDLALESDDEEVAQARASGIGALMGYYVGLKVGITYGLLRTRFQSVPTPLASIVTGAAAMAASDIPAAKLGVTDPKTWGKSGWASDIIPHLIYGIFTVLVFETLYNRLGGARR